MIYLLVSYLVPLDEQHRLLSQRYPSQVCVLFGRPQVYLAKPPCGKDITSKGLHRVKADELLSESLEWRNPRSTANVKLSNSQDED